MRIDPGKVREARYDGKWGFLTNTDLPAGEVALQYKRLLQVESLRAAKNLLETRPIFHKYRATITGHIFVSFLALVLVEVREVGGAAWGEALHLEDAPQRGAGKVFGAVGVAVPPPAREVRGTKTVVQAS